MKHSGAPEKGDLVRLNFIPFPLGLIIETQGIECLVHWSIRAERDFSWVARDKLEVINETR